VNEKTTNKIRLKVKTEVPDIFMLAGEQTTTFGRFYSRKTLSRLEGKYFLESIDPRESEIRTPPQPVPYLMPIPPNTLFYNK